MRMTLVPFFPNSKAWTSGRLHEPWDTDRISIYEFLLQNVDEKTGKLFDSCKLPDEPRPTDSKLRWGAGMLDGVLGTRSRKPDDSNRTELIFSALTCVLQSPSAENIGQFYYLISNQNTLSYLDRLIARISSERILHDEALAQFSVWLAKNAPDRGPVKVGIALAGVTTSGEAEEIISTLGKHDEFTLYAVVALNRSSSNPETRIWELAQSVTGWGRIQAVRRLKDTKNEKIKAWMLRDGFRNRIMNEYLACICAQTGDLLTALQGTPEETLLVGARDIISALIMGGPAEDISDYEDGPEVAKRFLELISDRDIGLAEFLVTSDIDDFVSSRKYKRDDTKGKWTPEIKAEIFKLSSSILERDYWKDKAQAGLLSSEPAIFFKANQVAKRLGIDTWDLVFNRIKADPRNQGWWEVMQSSDVERIRKVVELACKVLPLDQIASGPSDSLGLGEKYWAHSALNFVLGGLYKYPGVGWTLIKNSLQSPVISNRNLALKALNAWPRSSWPGEAQAALESAARIEPKIDVRERIKKLMAGEDIAS